MIPLKITTALGVLASWTWSQQVNVAAEEKVAMGEVTEIKNDAKFMYPEGSFMPDLDPDCATWAEHGECHWNHEYMFKHCIESCMSAEDFGTIGYFIEDEGGDEVNDEESEDCINMLDSDPVSDYTCEELSGLGECHMNPVFMKEHCARSCLQCLPAEAKRFRIGVTQEIMKEYRSDKIHVEETLMVITETSEYLSTRVMEESAYEHVRRYCFNEYEYCASMAAAGDCLDFDDNAYYYFMMTRCAPACQACLTYELIETCTPDEEDNIFEKGGLDRMFKRIVGETCQAENALVTDYEPVIHSRPDDKMLRLEDKNKEEEEEANDGPWVVTLGSFLSDEECERLIELGERSNDDADKYKEEELDPSISLNSWCRSDCYNDPVMKGIIERMSEITGIPGFYSEPLQMLKYSTHQKYEEYNVYDQSEDTYQHLPGPTVVTVFLFLNDVEEGGEIRFDDLSGNGEELSLNILPKKGSALILPSVQNDPSIIEKRTLHQSLPVQKGVKYGVKATFHLRSYDHDNCDYDAFKEFKWW